MVQIVSRKTCTCSKRCYPNEGSARVALIECRARGRHERRYYQCGLCKEWHLTSQPYMPKAA
jgi:hypothetical protein